DQRARLIFPACDQTFVAGSNTFVSDIPKSAVLWPPTVSMRPSSRLTTAEQNNCELAGTCVNASWPAATVGSKTRAEGVPGRSHASQVNTLPVCINDMCTESSGQFSAGDHSPSCAEAVLFAVVNEVTALAELPNGSTLVARTS